MSLQTFTRNQPKPRTGPDKKVFTFIEHLLITGQIQFEADFYKQLGFAKGNYSMVKSGKSSYTIAQITFICRTYNLNANWILGLEKNMFCVNSSS